MQKYIKDIEGNDTVFMTDEFSQFVDRLSKLKELCRQMEVVSSQKQTDLRDKLLNVIWKKVMIARSNLYTGS